MNALAAAGQMTAALQPNLLDRLAEAQQPLDRGRVNAAVGKLND